MPMTLPLRPQPLRALVILLLPLLGPAAPALAQGQPTMVRVAQVEQRPITLASRLVATIEPMVQSTIAAEGGAILRERHFTEGQAVEKGILLAKLDDALLLARLASAEAAARSAEAELERAQLIEDNLRLERERVAGLYRQNVATEKENLDANNAHQRAIAAVTVAEANVAEQLAAVDEIRLQVERTQVFAPFSGVVNRRYVEVGQWVRQGDPVAEVVQLDPLYVRTGVPEGVVSRLTVGATAKFTVDALGGREFEGTVAEILPVANPESRTFPVRLRVDNPEGLLRPGMFARATVAEQTDSLVVPKDAVVNMGGRMIVVKVDNGAARTIQVQLGAADETSQAVTAEGLKAGDLVVVRGNEGLMDGTPLIVQNPPGAAGGPGGQGGGPPAGAGAEPSSQPAR